MGKLSEYKKYILERMKDEPVDLKVFDKGIDRAESLTLDAARKLEGKSFYYIYCGYNGWKYGFIEKARKVITKMEWAETDTTMAGYASRAEYWRKELPRAAEEAEHTFVIPDKDGKEQGLYAHENNPDFPDTVTFTCPDSDIEVYYFEPGE